MFSSAELSKIKTLIRRTGVDRDISVFWQAVEKFTACRSVILNYMPINPLIINLKVTKAYNLIKYPDLLDQTHVDSLVYDVIHSYDFLPYLFVFDTKYGYRDIDELRSGTPTYLDKGLLEVWNSLNIDGKLILYFSNSYRVSLPRFIRTVTSSTHRFISDYGKLFSMLDHIQTSDGSILVFEKLR